MTGAYSEEFFAAQEAGSARSAGVIVPLFLSMFPVRSVVDIGCGVGGWLKVFGDHGVADHLGVDGDYVPRHRLRIEADRFHAADLAAPLDLGRSFEAAVCLEVAEHLPLEAGDRLVKTLAKAAPLILFSAAIPFQGGIDHLNEQWPSFWASRFHEAGFVPLDVIRPHVQWNRDVEFWYRQNILVFCRADQIPAGMRPSIHPFELDRVDLELYCYLKSQAAKLG